jgi:hypothetical protein
MRIRQAHGRRSSGLAAALGLGTAMILALPAVAQPVDELPDFLAPDLPPGVDRFCGGAIIPDVPPDEPQAVESASEELPPLPEWCDGTCTIDIAFFYAPEVITGTRDGFPVSIGALRARAFAAINIANVAFRRAGLDAELRLVGMERDSGLSGLNTSQGHGYIRRERLIHARQEYGADLIYAITGEHVPRACGVAGVRGTDMRSLEDAAYWTSSGAIFAPCLGFGGAHHSNGMDTLAHEVGHNLGLLHNPEHTPSDGFVPFGHGYRGSVKGKVHYTIMGPGGGMSLTSRHPSRCTAAS